jgi:AraC family transcriptional regulator
MSTINISEPEIITFPEKNLIGLSRKMSFGQNTTHLLWQQFMPRRKEIKALHPELFSLQVYPEGFFDEFNSSTEFDKWAATAVSVTVAPPVGMEKVTIPKGRYAVFQYKGNPANGAEVFRYIFTEWLLQSGYTLDNRPHFEVLGEKYKNDSYESEEAIYIPVK